YLRSLGVGPETRVALCIERSLEMVVGLFGIMKSGGAYVPLDPSYPAERLAYVLEDARAPVLVTQLQLQANLPPQGAKTVLLDGDWSQICECSETAPIANLHPGNLAYLIYTSGSTGQPKGTAIEHRSAATLLHWSQKAFEREDISGVLASTSICFDLSVFEL